MVLIMDKSKKEKHNASVFETLAILDNTSTDPETGVARPSDESVKQAKDWVDENEL
jgi:hypothetical protein